MQTHQSTLIRPLRRPCFRARTRRLPDTRRHVGRLGRNRRGGSDGGEQTPLRRARQRHHIHRRNDTADAPASDPGQSAGWRGAGRAHHRRRHHRLRGRQRMRTVRHEHTARGKRTRSRDANLQPQRRHGASRRRSHPRPSETQIQYAWQPDVWRCLQGIGCPLPPLRTVPVFLRQEICVCGICRAVLLQADRAVCAFSGQKNIPKNGTPT